MHNRDVVVLIIGFSIIFAGYNAAQQYLSSVLHTEGAETVAFISLSLIYLTLAAANSVSPWVCRKIGLKKSLIFSSLMYPMYIIAVSAGNELAVYVASIMLGVAAAILWTAHGVYIVRVTTDKNRGFYSGVAFSLLNLGGAAVVFGSSFFVETVSYSVIYMLFAVLAGIGVASLLLLRKVKTDEDRTKRRVDLHKHMTLLIPFVFSSSIISGFMISSIPIRMTDLFGLAAMGRIAGVYIFMGCLTPLIVGWLSDKGGTKMFTYLTAICQIAGFSLLMSSVNVVVFGLGVILLAWANGSYLALIYPLINKFGKDISQAMALRMAVMSLAVVASIVLSGLIGFFWHGIIAITLSLIALATVFLLFKK